MIYFYFFYLFYFFDNIFALVNKDSESISNTEKNIYGRFDSKEYESIKIGGKHDIVLYGKKEISFSIKKDKKYLLLKDNPELLQVSASIIPDPCKASIKKIKYLPYIVDSECDKNKTHFIYKYEHKEWARVLITFSSDEEQEFLVPIGIKITMKDKETKLMTTIDIKGLTEELEILGESNNNKNNNLCKK